jgi:hypothetical protein
VVIYIDTSPQVKKLYLILIFYLFEQDHADHGRVLEYSTLWYFSGAFNWDVFQRFLSNHGKVFTTLYTIL